MKKHNPSTPLLVREAFGVPAKIWARYGESTHIRDLRQECSCRALEMGKESSVDVNGLSAAEVEKKLQELAQKSA